MSNKTHRPWHVGVPNLRHGGLDTLPNTPVYGSGNMACYILGNNQEANARLIAAAPSLLAACEAALAEICTLTLTAKYSPTVRLTMDSLQAAIKAAKE